MNQTLILQPVVALFLLTVLVWVFMYARRLSFILANNVDPQSLATPDQLNAGIPANINSASHNLKNLFELPVVFYALCAFLLLSQQVDEVYLYAAWAFSGLRVLHSLIHCTVNIVTLRFAAYSLSSLALWFMVVRLAWSVF